MKKEQAERSEEATYLSEGEVKTKIPIKGRIEDIQFIEEEVPTLYSNTMKGFVGESLNTAILDSGCTKNVCGSVWLDCYIDSLSEEEKESIIVEKSMTKFRFGSGDVIESLKRIVISAEISGKRISIVTDVIDCDIPLLLSKDAMKKAQEVVFLVSHRSCFSLLLVTAVVLWVSIFHY